MASVPNPVPVTSNCAQSAANSEEVQLASEIVNERTAKRQKLGSLLSSQPLLSFGKSWKSVPIG
jgi:hypothetical protein